MILDPGPGEFDRRACLHDPTLTTARFAIAHAALRKLMWSDAPDLGNRPLLFNDYTPG